MFHCKFLQNDLSGRNKTAFTLQPEGHQFNRWPSGRIPPRELDKKGVRGFVSRGFTLIEFLIGISIFAVVAAALYATFANGIRLDRQARELEDYYRKVRWAMETLTLDLENMVPYRSSRGRDAIHKVIVGTSSAKNVPVAVSSSSGAADGEGKGSFSGDASSLSLVLATGSGLKEVRYYLKEPEETRIHQTRIARHTKKNVGIVTGNTAASKIQFLVREERPFPLRDPASADRQAREEILSRQVTERGLKFSYAAREAGSDGKTVIWKDAWDASYFPVGVSVEMSLFNPRSPKRPLVISKEIVIPTAAWGVQEY